MALSGSRLEGQLKTDILAKLQAKFPIPSGLLSAEQTALQQAQQKLADAIAEGSGTDIVTEITGHAVVPTGIALSVTSGPGAGSTGATSAPGTVT